MKKSEFLNQAIKKAEEVGTHSRKADEAVTEFVNWLEKNFPDEWEVEVIDPKVHSTRSTQTHGTSSSGPYRNLPLQ